MNVMLPWRNRKIEETPPPPPHTHRTNPSHHQAVHMVVCSNRTIMPQLMPQVHRFEYDLVLHPDVNTRGHTQWFYFAVSNTRAGTRYKFNIINLMKDDSLYNDGMLPLVHSRKGFAGEAADVCPHQTA
jgi:hypothetical protein